MNLQDNGSSRRERRQFSAAQKAAIVKAHRATVHTADRDFQRFPGLDCRFPVSEVVRK